VKESARAIGSHKGIVDGLVVGRGIYGEVLSFGKCVGKSLFGVHFQDAKSDIDLPPIAAAVKDVFAVAADIFKSDAGGVVGAPGQGINENLLGSVQGTANVEQRKILISGMFTVEIAAAAFDWDFKGVRVEEFAETLGESGATREIREGGFRALLLSFDPGSRFRTVLVFQPAISVSYHGAAVGVLYGIDSRRRWTLCG
jgi:hypothetical protein